MMVVTLLGLLLLAAGIAWTIDRSGRAPGEVLDHVDRRLIGHPRLEAIAAVPLRLARAAFDAPDVFERRSVRFVVPPPPRTLASAQAVAGPRLLPAAGGRVWRVGPGGDVATIADAARQARDGDVVEIPAGDWRGDVAVWNQKRLTIRGSGGMARLFADGRIAEGKAIWVLRNGEFDIEDIAFIGARADDRNGAGIRFEGGTLRLRRCLFWDNQTGLLTAGGEGRERAVLQIDDSEFGYNGHADGQSHNLYVGQIGHLIVRGSHLHHANVGHLLKSRAVFSEVIGNRLVDGSGGRASYELNFPNGGLVKVIGNYVRQGRSTENATMLAYGEEGLVHQVNVLGLASNTFVNDLAWGGIFVRTAPGTQRLVSANNLWVGSGRFFEPEDRQHVGDAHAKRDWFVHLDDGAAQPRVDSPTPAWRQPPTDPALGSLMPVRGAAQLRGPMPPSYPGAWPWP